MDITLSPRLQACANMVKVGERVADVGCDHGYLSIYLLKRNIASSIYASDIREGPLASAKRNAVKYGVSHNITFSLTDGAQGLPHDFDTMVCAGMGGDVMISILKASPWLRDKRLILQCQSKAPALRQYLYENGWCIERELVVRDGRFLYTVMEVYAASDQPPITVGEFYFPYALSHNPTKEVREYYKQVVKKLRIFVKGHGDQAAHHEAQALAYLENLNAFQEE